MGNQRSRVVAALALICVLGGCAGEEPQGISVPLSGTGDSGNVYVLRDARFRIVGPRTITLAGDETSGDVLSVGLPPGDYSISLLSGWSLVRLPDGTEMIATLASANPQMVTVTTGARVRVTFVFDVMGEVVTMTGDGDIDIGFEVRDDAGSAAPDAGACVEGVMRPCGVSDIGACRLGNEFCMGGAWVACDAILPSAETCNAQDDDCDGAVDEETGTFRDADADGFADASSVCMPGPMHDCDDTNPMIHPGAPEACGDGADNDCDASVDEGCGGACMPADARACGSDIGECVSGVQLCDPMGFWGACSGEVGPSAEVCNALDDDCDGVIDEGNPGGGGACGTDIGECAYGTQSCVAGALVCVGSVGPSVEVCNGADDDCDAVVDEDNPDGGAACGTDVGQCSFGTTMCVSGALVCSGGVTPTVELCNAADDDCDGMIDEGC